MKKREVKRTNKRRKLLMLCILFVISVGITYAASITTYNLVKPWITTITTTAPDLQIDNLTFNYDVNSNQYTSVDISVHNYGGSPKTGTVYIKLYNSVPTEIASGSASTGSVNAGATVVVSVSLSWSAGKTVSDLQSGRAVIVPT